MWFTCPKNLDQSTVLGSSCTSSNGCESRFCWPAENQTVGECTAFCERSGRDCGVNQVCAELGADFGICLGECSRNSDCQGGNICYLDIDTNANAIHGYCRSPIGDLDTGEDCNSPADCGSGLCLTRTSYQMTSSACTSNSQCDQANGFECTCPPDNAGCAGSERRCVNLIESSRCSQACDQANGNADCTGSHGMSECDGEIRFTWSTGSELVSACSEP